MSSLTQKQAIAKAESKWWEGKSFKEIVDFQLYEPRLCMPFDRFHEAVEKVLGRPVFTHEFADDKTLQMEYEGKIQYQGFAESIDRIIPKDKLVIVVTK